MVNSSRIEGRSKAKSGSVIGWLISSVEEPSGCSSIARSWVYLVERLVSSRDLSSFARCSWERDWSRSEEWTGFWTGFLGCFEGVCVEVGFCVGLGGRFGS